MTNPNKGNPPFGSVLAKRFLRGDATEMPRITILATMAMLGALAGACSEATPVDQPPPHPVTGSGSGGRASTGGQTSDAASGSGGGGLADAAEEATGACPQGAYRYDGG